MGQRESSDCRLERSNLISELGFSRSYSSLWRALAPTLDLFVRQLNRGLYERTFAPIPSDVTPNRRAFVNEIAFELLCQSPYEASTQDLASAVDTARQALQSLPGDKQWLSENPDDCETAEVRELARRLSLWFLAEEPRTTVLTKPKFPGCGYVDTSYGDAIAGTTLVEIKAGERPFRSTDIRQLVTYLALNLASRSFTLEAVRLLNPRIGIKVDVPLDILCFEISGRTSGEMLADVVSAISSGDLST